MKNLIEHINKCFENRVRLGIMSALMVNPSIDFNSLKELLGCTDGNLSSNVGVLEDLGYVRVQKRIIRKKTNTSYTVTKSGKQAFQIHLDALEKLIRDVRD